MKISFNKYFAFGGLDKLNSKSILLRKIQIEDKVKIHTCNDYSNSIEVIKEASSKKSSISIILKVYFNYPDKKNRRFRPIISQIEEAVSRLTFLPNELILQMCCYFPLDILKKEYFSNFLSKIHKDFGVKKIYFEYYPVYKYDFRLIKEFNDSSGSMISLGVTGYFNFWNRVINVNQFNNLRSSNIPFIPIGILGKNIKRDKMINKLSLSKGETSEIDYIDQSLIFFIKQTTMTSDSIFGITETSKESNYLDLKNRIKKLELNKENIFQKIKDDNIQFNYLKKDHYGGKFFLSEYFLNPKQMASNLKKSIIYGKSKSYFLK